MDYIRLGTAGLKVSRICLGTNMLGAYVNEADGVRVIDTFLDSGGNFIDTADMYAQTQSEQVIGKALRKRRHEAVIATKVGAPMGDGPNDKGNSRSRIISSVDQSLKRLGTDYIDLYILHVWDPETPLEESLRAMDDLVRHGKIRYVGVSQFNSSQVMKSLWIADQLGLDPIRSVQIQYSFLEREPERELLPLCEELGLIVTPFWVLRAGMFSGRYEEGKSPPPDSRFGQRPDAAQRYMNEQNFAALDRIQKLSTDTGHSIASLTIAWALTRPAIGSVIAGSSKPEQVQANCAAVDIRLSDEELTILDAIGK